MARLPSVRSANQCLLGLGTAGRVVGHVYIHSGDDSGFVCEPD